MLIATTTTSFAQDVLLIVTYSKAGTGKSFWCRDMEMFKQVVKTRTEAEQLAVKIKKEHEKESPFSKIFDKGSVVFYEYQKEDKAFNCTYRVISWKTGKTDEEARQILDNEKASIAKEFKGQPSEFYSWVATSRIIEDNQREKDGFEEKYKKIITNGKTTAYVGFFKNNNTDVAIKIEIRTYPKNIKITPAGLEEGTKPNYEPKPMVYTLQPGEKLNLSLDKVDNTDIRVYKVPVNEENDSGMIQKTKILIREAIIKDGTITPRKMSNMGGVRG